MTNECGDECGDEGKAEHPTEAKDPGGVYLDDGDQFGGGYKTMGCA